MELPNPEKNKSVQLLGGVKSLQVRTDLEVDLKRTQSYCMEYVIGPISALNDYLNTVFDDVVSLCRSCRNNALPQSLKNKSVQLLGGVKSLQVRTDLEVDLKRTQSYCMEYVIGPISALNDYLNTVFDDVVSLCRSCRNNALPQSLREKL